MNNQIPHLLVGGVPFIKRHFMNFMKYQNCKGTFHMYKLGVINGKTDLYQGILHLQSTTSQLQQISATFIYKIEKNTLIYSGKIYI